MTDGFKSKHTARFRAFTIVELLVSMAIIFILVGTAFYALKVTRRSAGRTETANALRQMMTAYSNYSGEHSGRLMPGYLDQATLTQMQIVAKSKSRQPYDQFVGSDSDSSSYVWRLAPYMDHEWTVFLSDYRGTETLSKFADEYSCGDYICQPYVVEGVTHNPPNGVFGPGSIGAGQLGIGLRPSFGLNSIYVGGDTSHGDTSLNPWTNPTGRVAALRMSEVKSPAKLIVFAPTRAVGLPAMSGVSDVLGYAQLCPPYAAFDKNTQTPSLLQWQFDAGSTAPDQIAFTGIGGRGGVPVDRMGDHKVAVAHLDNSVGTETLEGMGPSTSNANTRMTRWSPFAVGE